MANSLPGSNLTQLPLAELTGALERIVYQNDETGYTIARLEASKDQAETTIVGNLVGIHPGERLRMQGMWVNHPQYGHQFEVHQYTVEYPATLEGIRRYLGSGLIRGIGKRFAARIVDTFGESTLEVLENEPERLREVPGLGRSKIKLIAEAWQEQRAVKDIMIFLQSIGVTTGLAARIYKQYGDQSVNVVRDDPYKLARDISGIGFKTADQVARQIGTPLDHPSRIQAGLLYALNQATEDGHCFLDANTLVNLAAALLQLDPTLCQPQLDALVSQQAVIAEDEAVYLPAFHHAEASAAEHLRKMLASPDDRLAAFRSFDWEGAFALLDKQSSFALTVQQKEAVRMALTSKVSILTGGPGTGKSTITHSVIQTLRLRSGSVLLCAPTGRAAKRLSEATGLEAKTIHRLLEYKPTGRSTFQRDSRNPLNTDLIIVDETSMIDIILFHHLLNAIELGSHLLLVGDVDQLPSVGPGNVLRDLINSQVIPVTRLETIFRQAADSFIIINAHRVNHGEMPEFARESTDFFLFGEEDPQKTADWVVELASKRIHDKFGHDPVNDIQVLAPMYRGAAGVTELNQRLQTALNPPNPRKIELKHGQRLLRVQDRVIQTVNNYDLQVFNGDLGVIQSIEPEDQVVTVKYDNRLVKYEAANLDEISLAYAISIHKAQGSEFPVVLLPILTQHYMMLQRNLLYTGITRARKMVVLVGSKRAIARAVNTNEIALRNTRLADRLRLIG